MKKWVGLIIVALLAAAAGYWMWVTFFPSAEVVIKKRLNTLAQTASFGANEPPLSRLANAQKIGNYVTTEVEITVDVPGRSQQSFSGREELTQAVVAARSTLNGLNVEFLDIIVTVGPEGQTAVANLTARARIPGERDFYIQELKFTLKKIEGTWLISKIETVKTLSFRLTEPANQPLNTL